MVWMSLIVAGLFEMVGVLMIHYFHQKRSFIRLLALVGSFSLSFILLAYSMQHLAMGTAYAVWTGIGASGGAILGVVLFKEPYDWKRLICISLILVSAIGLKLTS
ncbi:multidrug efflux SMR transporter [Vagococcus lutrae]|uniref:DMT family transporter n=2 Tax=Vagococcus lutrae TaxID=81947 RepID=UPI001C982748|nr:multidrug efflux SMR transporter [Vagococcus lutrae]MDT2817841.1 multidrug efflux SMR transporter [Vagococcus lutrae]MDT2826185.1 multidrug efflux SMR transporter [Vagococcus lutrae]MDY3705941.1 multidrug efflux SMR transporter [Vagococcus lutrae]QZN88014.1 multidrug efflux SMR transporter [Vagococcus lutrae]